MKTNPKGIPKKFTFGSFVLNAMYLGPKNAGLHKGYAKGGKYYF